MPSPATIDEYLELVRKSGVVEETKLTLYLDRLRSSQPLPNTPGALAGLLVRDGLLTRFQAEQCLQGKWRRFSLGKYKVLEKLGAGGMGTVYLCEHKLMRRRVAVKVLPETKAADATALERFYREARAVAALDHPNIVRAYDIDQDGKLHFLVMEHVDGSSLQDIVKKTGPMDVTRACHYIRQAALGLQHAHESAGIVHRDIKPSNILVDRNGIVKILDMGLALFFHDEEDLLTRKFEENVLGTADYLAPEQALDSHSVDIRADIYSLGATFYFCLTGLSPFAEGSVAQKLIWHQTRQPKPIRQLRPETPESLAVVVEKMMAKDPSQRPQTPLEAAEALLPWTQTPVPPPPDHEMPQLSPAAMGGASDSGIYSGPKTPPSGNDLSPRSRLSSPATPSTAPSSNTSSPLSSSNVAHKSSPPPGALNLQLSRPLPPPLPSQRAGMIPEGQAAAAQLRGGPPSSYQQPEPVNVLAPVAAPQREPNASWEEILGQAHPLATGYDRGPPSSHHAPVSVTRRGGGARTPPRSLAWVMGIASAIVLGIIVIAGILTWMFNGRSSTTGSVRTDPVVVHVNPHGGNGVATSLAEALEQLRGRSKQPARIIVQNDLAENDVIVDTPHVSIEAEEGRVIHWRPSLKPGGTKLFAISKAEGVRIKGFTLDGNDRLDFLINLNHRCPGTKLEDLKLQGFKKYGIWVTNCEGGDGPNRSIQLDRLEFLVLRKDQTAVFFSIVQGMRALIPKNRFFTFHDCTFLGDGTPVKTPDLASLANIEWPPNVQPVQGQ